MLYNWYVLLTSMGDKELSDKFQGFESDVFEKTPYIFNCCNFVVARITGRSARPISNLFLFVCFPQIQSNGRLSSCALLFFWASRYVVYMDANGDTQGNYTLIGRQPYESTNHEDGLYPVGVFHIPRNHSTIPVSILTVGHPNLNVPCIDSSVSAATRVDDAADSAVIFT